MKKIAKKIKMFIALLLISVITFGSMQSVEAVSQTIQLGSTENVPGYIAGIQFTTKTTTSGDYVYCLNNNMLTAQNVTATLVGELDAGFAYIMENGYPNKSFTGEKLKDYYITQTAVWWYLDDTTGSSNLSVAFKTNGTDNYNLRPYIKTLVANAKAAREKGYATTSLKVSTTDTTMSLSSDAKYYVSQPIEVTSSNISTYQVSVEGASGVVVTDEAGNSKTTFTASEKFIVKLPISKLSGVSANLKITVKATGTVNKAYEYKPTDATMQNVMPSVLTPTKQEVSANLTLEISSSKVSIIKVDKSTQQPLAGAKLVLKDSAGNVLSRWTSTINARVIRNLSNGTYTIEEEEAPKGYKRNTEKVTFTITDEKKEVTAYFFNEPRTSVITITKIDSSTGNILPGAVLVVKNASGEEIARFTTTEDPYVLVDLEDGTYTVEEESAPTGYKKSDEIITFTIDENNLSHQINFANYPEIYVPNTKAASTIGITLLGIILIASTIGFIYKNAHRTK